MAEVTPAAILHYHEISLKGGNRPRRRFGAVHRKGPCSRYRADGGTPFAQSERSATFQQAAEKILNDTGIKRGYCLVVGLETGQLAWELAKRSHSALGVNWTPAMESVYEVAVQGYKNLNPETCGLFFESH